MSALLDEYLNWGWHPERHSAIHMRRVRTLAATGSLLLLLVVPFLLRAYQWQISIRMVTLPAAALLGVMGLVMLRTLHTERGFRVCAHLSAASLFVGGVGSVLSGGGLGTVNQGWLMLVPLLAGITLGLRGAMGWGGLVLVTVVILGLMQANGYVLVNQTPLPFQRFEALMQSAGLLVALLMMISSFLSQIGQFELVLASRNEQLLQQIAEREKAEQDARRAELAKTRFLANMSHELRTPLNSILGFAQRLEKSLQQRLSEREQDALAHLMENASYLLALVEDVFDLSAIDSDSMKLTPGVIDVRQLLTAVQHQLAPVATLFNLSLEVQANPSLMVSGDVRRLQQVLANVIRHSLKYTQTGGVSLSACHEGEHLYIDVIDSAPPLTAEMRERIFDRYNHLHSLNDRDAGGSALGMAVASAMIALHGGCMEMVDAPQGNHYRISLPGYDAQKKPDMA